MKIFSKPSTNNSLLETTDSIEKRVIESGIWIVIQRVLTRVLSTVKTIIVARLLFPEDFGLFGISLLSLSIMDTLSQTGLNSALIQKKQAIESYLDSAWTTQVIRGFLISIILIIGAPYIAHFFKQPEVVSLIRLLALGKLFQGFTNIGIVYFQKNLEFKKQSIFLFVGVLIDFIFTLVFAFIFRNVWALIIGTVVGEFVRMLLSFFLHYYRPKFRFDKNRIIDLMRYGRWISGSTILLFLVTQGDDILLGRWLGASALGYYQMAYQISSTPAIELNSIISQIMLPAYSKLQDDPNGLIIAYEKVLKFSCLLSVFINGLIIIFAQDFVGIFLGGKWLPIVNVMRILSVASLIRSIIGVSGSFFQGVGRPYFDTIIQTIRLVVLFSTIYPLTTIYGYMGTSISVLISISISGIIYIYFSIRHIKFSTRIFWGTLLFSILDVAMMSILIQNLRIYFRQIHNSIIEFVLLGIIGISSFVLFGYFVDKYLKFGFLGDLKLITKTLTLKINHL